MIIHHTIEDFRAWRSGLESKTSVGFTPTMGALHEGHLSHIRSLYGHVDQIVASVYVNPSQFSPGEDFEKYPRDLEGDARKLQNAGCNVLFYPNDSEIYPSGFSTAVSVQGVTDRYEGFFRPAYFQGVATIVCKLLNVVDPDVMTLGQKDAQQVAVIQRMMIDLNLRSRIQVIETVREEDGLAMSSRNVYLSPGDRREALTIHHALLTAKVSIAEGRSIHDVTEIMRGIISSKFRIDYCDIVNPATFSTHVSPNGPLLAIFAGTIGSTRLIDNIVLR